MFGRRGSRRALVSFVKSHRPGLTRLRVGGGAEPLERRVLFSDTVSLLKDINEVSPYPSTPTDLFDVDGTVYSSGADPTFGRELFASDGTAAGTRLVKDINPRQGFVFHPLPVAGAPTAWSIS